MVKDTWHLQDGRLFRLKRPFFFHVVLLIYTCSLPLIFLVSAKIQDQSVPVILSKLSSRLATASVAKVPLTKPPLVTLLLLPFKFTFFS